MIADAVERLRAKTDSRVALLIAHRDRMLFHSLLLLAHRDPLLAEKWQTILLAGTRWKRQNRTPLERYMSGEIDDSGLLKALRKQPPFERIAHLLKGDIHVLGAPRNQDVFAPTFPTPASVHAVLVGPRCLDPSELTMALAELHVMVNGSAAVVVHGNLEAERTVDAVFDRIGARSPGVSPSLAHLNPDTTSLSAFAETLLKSALKLTKSRLGNVYLAARDGEWLELVAHERNVTPRDRIAIDDPESVVSWVYRRKRPMIINDIPDFLRVHPEGGVIDVAGNEGTPQRELAVPIVQHDLSGGAGTIIGVVNVERLQDDDADLGYSYRDVTVLRAVAHRVALWRANAMVQQTSTALAALMKRSTSAAEWQPGRTDETLHDPRLPSDALASHDIVAETLKSVYGLTRSFAATMRLLSPDRQWLIRFAAYPPERIDDRYPAIHTGSRRSVVAWVARHGTPCYLRNVRDRRERKEYRGLEKWLDVGIRARSEVCIPIFVGGRLVGVLDLESRFRDGYADSVGVAGAVAEQLGLAVQQARRFHEQEVLSMSTATTANVHELGKLVDQLRRIAKTHEGQLASGLRHIADGVIECSQSGAALPDAPPMTTTELVHRVLKDLELESHFAIRNRPDIQSVYSGPDALALRSALAALFDNAYANADPENPGCALLWRTTAFGGRNYTTLMIMNNTELPPDSTQLNYMFRRPLRAEHSRARLGAFTAGALIRSFGGDVFAVKSSPPRFIVGVDLPVDHLALADQEAA
jgi:GAF domain-containing protein